MELLLLRSCLGACKINHLLRTVPPELIVDQIATFDQGLRSTLANILRCPIGDTNWKQATLPFRLGGLGIRDTLPSATAAFISSISRSKLLADRIFPEVGNPPLGGILSVSFPAEDVNADRLLSQLHHGVSREDLNLASQCYLQAIIDKLKFDELRMELDVCGRARLSALASSNDSSSWLRAPPINSLGLSIPNSEFIMASHIWLGIPLFTSNPSPLCPCGSAIDPNGDHLLGCGHGPLRIRRHDALREIIFQALLLDNSQVKREQSFRHYQRKTWQCLSSGLY